jgi:two-component sensor histidine kinase
MVKRIQRFFRLYIFLFPALSFGQANKLSPDKQRLLLKLSLNYYTVVREGQVDQDSSLLIATKRDGLSRWTVITEGFGDQLPITNSTWIDKRQTGIPRMQLTGLHGIEHVKLLTMLGAYYAFQPGYYKNDIDSALYFLLQAKQESTSLHTAFWINQSLILLGKSYFKAFKVDEGTKCYIEVIKICQKTGDKLTEAEAWDYQGTYIPPLPKTIMLKIGSIKRANELYKQLHIVTNQINTLMNIAYLSFVLKDVKRSEASATKALQLQDSIGFIYTHYSSELLNFLFAITGDLGKEYKYALEAVKSAESTKDTLGLAYFYKSVGDVIYGANGVQTAIYWDKKSLEQFIKDGNNSSAYRTVNALINVLTMAGKNKEAILLIKNYVKKYPPHNPVDKLDAYLLMGDNYNNLKRYHEAESYYLTAEKINKENSVAVGAFLSAALKFKIGDYYFKRKQYRKAKIYLSSAELSGKILNSGQRKLTYRDLYKIDSLSGNFTSSLKRIGQYLQLLDQDNTLNQAKQVETLKIQYQTAQAAKNIQMLRQESTFQKQHADAIRKFTYAGLSVALIILGLMYNRYHIKKKQKDEIDIKNHLLEHVIGEKDNLLISKEWLLKEVHHRVKNNLHTVICLLESQAAYLKGDAREAIENSEHRIYAMSLIHQKLYQSEDVKTINVAVFLQEFIQYLNESFGTEKKIRFQLTIEQLNLEISQAIPISLIINEAVTNCIKYAFPGDRTGLITISMLQEHEQIKLIIADNGIGIDPDIAGKPSASLGLKLMKGLSEDIHADISFENNNGTKITIKFDFNSSIAGNEV